MKNAYTTTDGVAKEVCGCQTFASNRETFSFQNEMKLPKKDPFHIFVHSFILLIKEYFNKTSKMHENVFISNLHLKEEGEWEIETEQEKEQEKWQNVNSQLARIHRERRRNPQNYVQDNNSLSEVVCNILL